MLLRLTFSFSDNEMFNQNVSLIVSHDSKIQWKPLKIQFVPCLFGFSFNLIKLTEATEGQITHFDGIFFLKCHNTRAFDLHNSRFFNGNSSLLQVQKQALQIMFYMCVPI